MIDYHFSKTKMREFAIHDASLVKIMADYSVLIRLRIAKPGSNKFRNIVIRISKGKIRDNKIDKLLR